MPLIGGILVSSLARSQWETGDLRPEEAVGAVVFSLGFEAVRHVILEFTR